jgi:hypothetical protein
MYISMDRKHENGCEIQKTAFGASGILMRLKLVKTVVEEATHFGKNNAGLDQLHSDNQVSSFALSSVGLDRLRRFVLCLGCAPVTHKYSRYSFSGEGEGESNSSGCQRC